jgi:hypothetical protein
VVELWAGMVPDGRVSFITIASLGMESARNPLWPKLVSLRLSNEYTEAFVASVRTFLSPKVKSLALFMPRAQDARIFIPPIVPIVSERCHGVEELSLDIASDGSHSAYGVGALISVCRDTLRTLYIKSPFKAEYIPVIANLPQLRKLSLERAYFPFDLPLDSFPALEAFAFTRFQGQHLRYFLDSLHTTHLKVAKIQSVTSVDLKGSMAAISRFSASLKILEITAVTTLSTLNVFVPRLSFTNLGTVRLWCLPWGDNVHNPCGFRLSDRNIADLGTAMPNIIHLTLGSQTCPNLRCVTFRSLISLSKTCKGIETLAIKVNFQNLATSSVDGVGDGGTDGGSSETRKNDCNLRALSLGMSPFPNHRDSGRLVVALGKMFPSLLEVTGLGSQRSKWERFGRNVRALLEGS